MKYYIITGEVSGDIHGNNLIAGLKKADQQADIRFWDSSRMVSVMGFVEVAKHIREINDIFRKCSQDFLDFNPDVLILIDYPGFNLKMAKFAHERGIRTFYYIAPKLWARGENRIKKLRKWVDELFVIFPFEVEYFTKLGMKPHYCGNPLPNHILAGRPWEPVLGGGKTIALLAGSRKAEISWMMPRFVELEKLIRKDPKWDGYKLVVAGAPHRTIDDYRRFIPDNSSLEVIFDNTYALLNQSSAAVVCSGTASLETAIIGTPQVVCYGFNFVTYVLAMNLLKSKYISLANLILDKWIFKEMLQHKATPKALKEELERLTFDEESRKRMANDYAELLKKLGEGNVVENTAAEMVKILKNA